MKRLAILGSTGSIGQQTLDIVRAFPDRFSVFALAAGNNLDLLGRQIAEFKPAIVHHQSEQSLQESGEFDVLPTDQIAGLPEVDLVVVALSGRRG